jgi:CDP-glucose 4,6-dehydratase
MLNNFYYGKTVLITGHTGFKGSWLSYWLSLLGANVIGYGLSPYYEYSLFDLLNLKNLVNHHIGDTRDLESLSKVLTEIIFHLAAQALVKKSYEDPLLTFSTNVMGSLNVLEAVRHFPFVQSLVYITSDKCYWNNEWVWGYRENDALGGADPYSASKACAEHVFKSYYLSYFSSTQGLGCGSTRAGNVIGGGDRSLDRIVPDIIRSIESDKPIVLRNPQSTRPWQHVLDPLHGYLVLGKYLYDHPQHNGEAWNFGPSNQSIKTVYELTQLITRLWNGVLIEKPLNDQQFYESQLLHLSIDKAQTLLHWQPKWNFEKAVIKTGQWYQETLEGQDPKAVTKDQINDFMVDL